MQWFTYQPQLLRNGNHATTLTGQSNQRMLPSSPGPLLSLLLSPSSHQHFAAFRRGPAQATMRHCIDVKDKAHSGYLRGQT